MIKMSTYLLLKCVGILYCEFNRISACSFQNFDPLVQLDILFCTDWWYRNHAGVLAIFLSRTNTTILLYHFFLSLKQGCGSVSGCFGRTWIRFFLNKVGSGSNIQNLLGFGSSYKNVFGYGSCLTRFKIFM